MTNELLTIVFINKNGGAVFGKALKAARQLSSRILVVDSGSTDESKSYADGVQAQWVRREWPGDFADQRNFAQSLVNTEWVLFLDSDEVISERLTTNIKTAIQSHASYAFKFYRTNMMCGHPLKFGNMGPDTILRLYRTNEAHWEGKVHEKLVFDKQVEIKLIKGKALHYTYRNFSHWFDKNNTYAFLWAKSHQNQSCSLGKVIGKTLFSFFRSYFIQLGFLDMGWGFVTSIMHSVYTFRKYTALYDLKHLND